MSLNKYSFVCLLFLLVFVFVGIGVVSATNTTDSGSTDVNAPVPVVKMEKNLKTDYVKAENFIGLHDALSSREREKVVDLDSSCSYNSTVHRLNVNSNIKMLTINGNGAVIDGGNKYGFLKIYPGTSVTIRDLTIQNMNITTNGGAIENNGTLHLINCSFLNNSAINGGAVSSWGDVILEDCIISGNSALVGGALYIRNCNSTIYNNTISNNTASDANIFYIDNCNTNMSYNNVTDNNCNYSLLNIVDGVVNVSCNNFTDNHMESSLVISDGAADVSNNTFKSNTMDKGYVVYNLYKMNLTGNVFDDNTVSGSQINTTKTNFNVKDNVFINSRLKTRIEDIDDKTVFNEDKVEFDVRVLIDAVYQDSVHNGTVVLTTSNGSYNSTVREGVAHMAMPSRLFHAGVNVVNVSYVSLDDTYRDCKSNFTLRAYRDTYIVIGCDESVNPNEGYDIAFEVYDLVGEKLNECVLDVNIGEFRKKVYIDDGQGILTYTFGYDETYTIEAFFEGGEYYNKSNATKVVRTKKVETHINTTVLSNRTTDTKIEIKVLDSDDNVLRDALVNVTLDNGTSFIHNSTRPLALTLDEGSYTISIKFESFMEYGTSEKVMTLDVEKTGTILDAEIVNNTAGNVTVNVTLVDEFGKIVEDATITLKDENNDTISTDTTPLTGTTKTIKTTITRAGTKNITAIYTGNNIYKQSNHTITNTKITRRDTSLTTT
ncbi:MAG: hypothetical protein BZ136_09110, partial [Methanosphaera sp. rholeuAM74]